MNMISHLCYPDPIDAQQIDNHWKKKTIESKVAMDNRKI